MNKIYSCRQTNGIITVNKIYYCMQTNGIITMEKKTYVIMKTQNYSCLLTVEKLLKAIDLKRKNRQ